MSRRRLLPVLATAAVVLAAALLVAESVRRRGLYWYDVAADYRYEFPPGTALPVELDRGGFTLPEIEGAGPTVLLRMRVRATFSGRWFEPAIEVETGGRKLTQYFERGARGIRYVDLGNPAGGRVALRGRHLRWPDQTADLLSFPAPPLESGPLLVLAPHPDDAEIAAFGLYASADDPWVVTVSAGNNVDGRLEPFARDPALRDRLKGRLRVWDSVTVPLWGGVAPERALNLGYFNGSLARLYASPSAVVEDPVLGDAEIGAFREVAGSPLGERAAESSWRSLVDDLAALLEASAARTIVAPHPLLDAAADHKLSTVALLEALARTGPRDRWLLLYTNHLPLAEYWPFGPADSRVGLPPWLGEPLRARGVYSHALAGPGRIDKLFALEAQHDLRDPPRFASPSPLRRILGEIGRAGSSLVRDPVDAYSYMRRAPRPNELFVVYSEDDAQRLLEGMRDYLSRLRGDEGAADAYTIR